MSSIWSRLAAFILKHSLRLIAGTVVLAVFFGYWALQVETDHGGGHFLSSDSPEYIAEAEVEERFGSNQTLLYLIFPSADPSDPDFLGRLAQFTQEASEYEGVEYVLSLANAPYLVREADSLAVRSLYDAELSGSQQVTRVQQQPFLRDLLITEDGTQPAMVIKIDPVFNDTAERITLSDQIRTRAEAVVGEVALAGAPFMRSEYAKRITREMPMLTSLALLLSAFFLFLAFRSFRAILLPLVIVTFGFSWTLALIALSGHKTNVVTSILPALIVVIGIANAIHISTKFFSLYERLGNKRRALVGTIETVGVATFLTCLTTAVGFFALTLSGSDQLGDFGMFASAGIMI
ncbi:MAG: MMPL family transporter, partial [Bacteroidota bacterium]